VLSLAPFAIHLDAPVSNTLLFQDPATLLMDGIIDLHHDIMGLLIIIVALVSYVRVAAVVNFHETSPGHRDFGSKFGAITRHVNHHATLEVI
jgi:heme/copper-type cytochrome/quinol oxidase subunit 2